MTMPDRDLGPLLPALLEVFNLVNIAVAVVADRGHGFELWYANEPVAQLYGYDLETYLTIPPIDTVWPAHRPLLQQLSSAFRAGQPVPLALEFAGVRADGTELPLEVSLSGCIVPGGVAYVLALRDVGVGVKSQLSQLSLLEADRVGLVGTLAAGVAHEINNPLTSVLLNLRSLRKQLVTHVPLAAQAAAMRCHDDLTTGAERIATNVRALQTLATRSAPGRVDLSALVSASLRLAAPTLGPRASIIRQIFPVPDVHGEESRLGQAVLGMLLFAASGFELEPSSTSANRIVVEVVERDGRVIVEVSDNGRELSAEEASRAFDPFFRSEARGAGVGVGLGVARSVATTHGGGVTLAARPGGGTVISMRLPVAAP